MWKYTGESRPEFAHEPGPGQESVWDYPRPPILEPSDEHVEVRFGDIVLASTRASLRVLETASPPTYYIPKTDIHWEHLQSIVQSSYCEWKGCASYFTSKQDPASAVAWLYEQPSDRFRDIDGHASFYPSKAQCFVNGEAVRPQPGEFYGGWITDRVVGPFKGEPGTGGW